MVEANGPVDCPDAMTSRRRLICGGLALASVGAGGGSQAQMVGGLDLTALRGSVVFVDFWASWCGPCKLSFPYLRRTNVFYKGRPFRLISVNVDRVRADADRFLQTYGDGVPVIYDPKGEIAQRFEVKAMPTSILFGKDGRQRFVHAGFHADQIELYNGHIQELLGEV